MPKKIKGDNPRSKNFLIELYPDNAEHMAVFEKLSKSYNIVGILHNRDVYNKERKNEAGEIVNEIGELKKAHYHIIVSFENQRYLNAVADEIGLENRFLEKPNSFKVIARYLIHLDDEDKAQYTLDELFGSAEMIAKVKSCCTADKSDTYIVNELLAILDSFDSYVDSAAMIRIALEMGYISKYNRYRWLFNDLLYSHNLPYQKANNGNLKVCNTDFEEIV